MPELPVSPGVGTCGGPAACLSNPAGGASIQAYIDSTTDGGEWVLLWCYAHQGGTNDGLVSATLPLHPTDASEGCFSHAHVQDLGQQLGTTLSSSDIAEVRFYGTTSGHDRVVHFKTSRPEVKAMAFRPYNATSPSGNAPSVWTSGFTPLAGHNANLPAATTSAGYGAGPSRPELAAFPFYGYTGSGTGRHHWGIGGGTGSQAHRWEVDDYPNDDSRTTLHQIWVRFVSGRVTITGASGFGSGNEYTHQRCASEAESSDAYAYEFSTATNICLTHSAEMTHTSGPDSTTTCYVRASGCLGDGGNGGACASYRVLAAPLPPFPPSSQSLTPPSSPPMPTITVTTVQELQNAIDGTRYSTQRILILVASGTYDLSTAVSTERPQSWGSVPHGGGYTLRAMEPHQVVLDGGGTTDILDFGNTKGCYVWIDGIVFRHGFRVNDNGAAIYGKARPYDQSDDGTFDHKALWIKMTNCVFEDNTSGENMPPWADQCSAGATTGKGGALYFRGCVALTIQRCRFTNNQALTNGGTGTDSGGGAIYWSAAYLLIEDTVFEGNFATVGGHHMAFETTASDSVRPLNWPEADNALGLSAAGLGATGIKTLLRNCTFTTAGYQRSSHHTREMSQSPATRATFYMVNDIPAIFECPLGTWMSTFPSGNVDNFVGCAHACSAGTFGNSTYLHRAEDCTTCPLGHVCPRQSSFPTPCPTGTYMPTPGAQSTVHCLPCSPGEFNNQTGSGECTACPAGTLSDAPRATACDACPAGGYCAFEGAATVRQTFVACGAGTWSSATGATSDVVCNPCPPGTYNPRPGGTTASVCELCPRGTFQPVEGAQAVGECLLCPRHSISAMGSATSGECACEEGYYDETTDGGMPVCLECPSGSDCRHAAGNTLATLPIRRGYYRLSHRSIDVRRCPDASSNCGESIECPESNSGCRGTLEEGRSNSSLALPGRELQEDGAALNRTDGCYDDLKGVFCRLCKSRDDGRRAYYATATASRRAQCKECRESARDSILVFIGYLILAAVAVLLALCWFRAYLSAQRQRQLQYAWRAFTPHNKAKILIGFYMIATEVGKIYEVALPPSVKNVLSSFAIVVSFGFNGVSSVLECLGMRGYVATLAFYMITPPVLALFILLGAASRVLCTPRRSATALLETALPPLLKLAFLAYPLVTHIAFDAFACHKFASSEWLKADVSIRCDSAKHDEAKALAWAAIILYPIGLLLLNGGLLFSARQAIINHQPTTLSRATTFIYHEYEPQFFWWELVEMLRRFVLVGLMVLAQGSMMQLVMGTLLSAIFLLFQVQAAPYVEMSDDFLAACSSFGLFIIFLCSIAFKNHELVGLEDIQDKMSIEQESYYIVRQTALTGIMLATVFSALIISFFIFIVQVGIEARRLKREARASNARRLRYKADNEEVQAPELSNTDSDEKCFHLFLSHVWGTGQDQMRVVKQRLVEMIPDLCVFLDVDDLLEIGDLEGYIARSSNILVYCSRGYFVSKNCIRELVAAVDKQKPLVALTDPPEASHGGLSLQAIHERLLETDALSEKWGFRSLEESERSTSEYHERYVWPGGQALHDSLFACEAIEWNRIGHFQDVTMRLIAERLVPDAAGATYVDKEIVNQQLKPLPPPSGSFHIYCSALNPGAQSLLMEVSRGCGFAMHLESAASHRTSNALHVTTEVAKVPSCDSVLVYLNGQTWTRGEASDKLGDELMKAMELNVNILLVHEMPGAGGQEQRFACTFDSFFSCPDGATPEYLLKRGIYSSIAVTFKGGPWREASMRMLATALGMSKEEARQARKGGKLGLGFGFKEINTGLVTQKKGRVSSRVKRVMANSLARASKGLSPRRRSTGMKSVAVTSSTAADAEESVAYMSPRSFTDMSRLASTGVGAEESAIEMPRISS